MLSPATCVGLRYGWRRAGAYRLFSEPPARLRFARGL